MEQNKVEINIMIILDATSSFACIFPRIYDVLKSFFERLQRWKGVYTNVSIVYGLLSFGEDRTKIRIYKFEDSYFIQDWFKFYEKIEEIEFCRGAENGKEDINEALQSGLDILEKYRKNEAQSGILLLTDSLPEDMAPDLIRSENGKIREMELSFSYIYAYNDSYIPVFRMKGDAVGEITAIENLLGTKGEKIMEKTADEIIRKAKKYAEL